MIKSRIDAGKYQPRHPIPAEHQLAQETGLARTTVRKAVAALRDQHYVYSVHGLGTVVTPPDERPGQ
jgi:GntR family transcriptional regulator